MSDNIPYAEDQDLDQDQEKKPDPLDTELDPRKRARLKNMEKARQTRIRRLKEKEKLVEYGKIYLEKKAELERNNEKARLDKELKHSVESSNGPDLEKKDPELLNKETMYLLAGLIVGGIGYLALSKALTSPKPVHSYQPLQQSIPHPPPLQQNQLLR